MKVTPLKERWLTGLYSGHACFFTDKATLNAPLSWTPSAQNTPLMKAGFLRNLSSTQILPEIPNRSQLRFDVSVRVGMPAIRKDQHSSPLSSSWLSQTVINSKLRLTQAFKQAFCPKWTKASFSPI